jgi:hypothetical protein
MSVKNVARRSAQHVTQQQNSVHMEEVMPGKRKRGEPFLAGTRFELALLPANDDLAITPLAKPPGKMQQLPLTAA